ncbi:Uncharacterised protein [Mycobacteroides abscessus subsp. massiliense]|uniref:hypothetical protein n=2 Tax=Mycobacteroides abscessus TaxID=36809 RepID=UPI0009A64322|nr:hypothetical protein [Mycobacteroides abscessus]SKF37697.1 Uncharacterised protein [Mycobacteroides abscessus subsp. massiliense]SKF42608.1 Uncharacterised protein [Mycobacteroides abscessus subsp. massiliense]SKF47333.1 Uncharacterised protein [Mycobacteroides abscessus subsp. massiliense]SKF49539.1 Uncharacterised protein [Mycobacteroides abscessus subsp. massiliense]SKF50702.1 Uncharacterised protein [Mycobacteroides abscessus subsp. massiliense]
MTDEISLDFDSANATVEQLLAAADRIEAEGAVSPADMATLRQQCGERYEPFLQQHFQREYAREDAYKRVAAKLRADAERKRNTIRGFEQHDEDSRARIAALDESNGIATDAPHTQPPKPTPTAPGSPGPQLLAPEDRQRRIDQLSPEELFPGPWGPPMGGGISTRTGS